MRYEMQCSYLLGPLNSNGNESSAAVADNSHRNGFVPSLFMPFICYFKSLHTFLDGADFAAVVEEGCPLAYILLLPLAPDLAGRNKAHCTRNIAGMKAPLSRGPQRRLCLGELYPSVLSTGVLSLAFLAHVFFLHLITFVLLQELRVEQWVALTPELNEFVAQL